MLAIIPARRGSKGLPGKNIRQLNGKPLIAYTIAAALEAKNTGRIIVSTDSEEIMEIALEYGAECPFLRPAKLSTDQARGIDVIRHAITTLEHGDPTAIPAFVILQPTSPLRTAADIDNAITLFREREADSVISYCQESHPISWHKYLTDDGRLEAIFDKRSDNRQEERPSYYPNGAIYVLKRSLLEKESFYTEKSYAYLMDSNRSIDIDNLDDFNYAAYLMKHKNI